MIHLTLCGPWAGHTLCDGNKVALAEAGDRFVHAMWAPPVILNHPELCPTCSKVWADDAEED